MTPRCTFAAIFMIVFTRQEVEKQISAIHQKRCQLDAALCDALNTKNNEMARFVDSH